MIANHFNSKGGDQGLTSPYQPPARSSEIQRHAQATAVNAFVKDILDDAEERATSSSLGDINDFEFSGTAQILAGRRRAAGRRSSRCRGASVTRYVYQGNSQVLDQILISPAIRAAATSTYDIVHINAEFADQISDHDPQVLRFTEPVSRSHGDRVRAG